MSAKGATLLATKKTKSQEDALKKTDLCQKTMLSVEGQRILNILGNCISQIEIVAALPAILHINSYSCEMDDELIRELKKHQLIGERLETLDDVKGKSEGEDGEASIRVRAKLQSTIKFSVRDLLRLFRSHPDAVTRLMTEQGVEVGENESKLLSSLKMFHSHIKNKLLINADAALLLLLQKQTFPSLANNLEHLMTQEEEVVTALQQIDAKICHKNNEIKNMQCSLEANNTQDSVMSLFTAEKHQTHVSISKKHASMQQEIDQLNLQLNNLITENREEERVLQKKNEKVETEIKYLLQKFDREIEEKQADLELNEMDNEKEAEEMRGLEKPFSVLEIEYNRVTEKRQRREEQREKEAMELELKTKAAIFVQAWWRGYSTRKALQNKQKPKKAKKGKGKKI